MIIYVMDLCSNIFDMAFHSVSAITFFFNFFLKSLLNLLQYCFCFMSWFFGHETCGILAPRPGIEPTPPALEGEVLTTGLPGKSHLHNFYILDF